LRGCGGVRGFRRGGWVGGVVIDRGGNREG